MPKKFQGENTKAAEAKARKNAKKEEEDNKRKQAEEDEYWNDDDKNVQKKQQRKDEKLKKQQEASQRKLLKKQIHEDEMQNLASTTGKNLTPKVTRHEIVTREDRRKQELEQQAEISKLAAKNISINQDELVENVNRIVIDGEEARSIDQAIRLLDDSQERMDRNPEKRLKACYTTFEEARLPVLKVENPNLRLSQLKQMVKKEWQKSPDNPLNINSVV